MNKIYKLLIIGCLAFINQVSFASNQDVMNLFFMIEPHLKSYSKLKGLDITKHDLFEGSLGQVIELIDEFNRKVEEAQVEQHVNQTLISSQIHFRDYDHNIVSMEEILTPEGIENLRQGGVKFHKDLMRVRREAFRSGRTLRDSLNTNSRLEVKLSESDYQEWAKKCLQMTSDRYKRRERILNVMMERDLRSKSDKLTQVHKNISNIGPIFQFLNYSIQNGLNINDPEIYSYPEVHEILNGHSKIQEYLDNELANQFESSSIAPTKKVARRKKRRVQRKR